MAHMQFHQAFKAKLSRSLTLWVFVSLLAIETIILLPSYLKRDRDLTAAQVSLVQTSLDTALGSSNTSSAKETTADQTAEENTKIDKTSVLTALEQMQSQDVILGYTVITKNGKLLSRQGQSLDSDLPRIQALLQKTAAKHSRQAYDSAIHVTQTQPPLYIAIRHDRQPIQAELNAYTGRMISLVLIISVVITVATMIAVERIILRPVLSLRADLLTAINNLQHNIRESPFQSAQLHRNDELGEVVSTFQLLYEKIWQAVDAHEAASLAEQQERDRANQLSDNITHLHKNQVQLVQSEKMTSLSQLVAGIAHEINNPISFIHGNVGHLKDYMDEVLSLIQLYDKHYPDPADEISEQADEIDIAFIQEDCPKLLNSIESGSTRVRDVVLSLRNFSRLDESDIKLVDIHEGIENTLMMLNHRLTNEADEPIIQVSRDYDELPQVECYAGLLNQAFMSILFNAIEAFDNEDSTAYIAAQPQETFQPKITLQTTLVGESWAQITITNNGPPIRPEIQNQIFEPFFTTKPVGQGTGMGLSMAYQIVHGKHNGKLFCFSDAEADTEFVIQIPIKQP